VPAVLAPVRGLLSRCDSSSDRVKGRGNVASRLQYSGLGGCQPLMAADDSGLGAAPAAGCRSSRSGHQPRQSGPRGPRLPGRFASPRGRCWAPLEEGRPSPALSSVAISALARSASRREEPRPSRAGTGVRPSVKWWSQPGSNRRPPACKYGGESPDIAGAQGFRASARRAGLIRCRWIDANGAG
jgi:hypothetical protein